MDQDFSDRQYTNTVCYKVCSELGLYLPNYLLLTQYSWRHILNCPSLPHYCVEGWLAAKQAKPLNGVAQGPVLGSDLSCNTNIHGQAFQRRQFGIQTKSPTSCCKVAKIFRKNDHFLIFNFIDILSGIWRNLQERVYYIQS